MNCLVLEYAEDILGTDHNLENVSTHESMCDILWLCSMKQP